jgi:serine/threonine-protein kinase RsbW
MRVVVQGDVGGLGRLAEAVGAFLRAHDLPAETSYAVRLVAEEAATNIVRHAYPPGRAGDIDFEILLAERGVVLRFEDEGRLFDPTTAPPHPPEVVLETAQVGGRGIPLLRAYAESLRYRREGRRNVFEIVVPAVADPRASSAET